MTTAFQSRHGYSSREIADLAGITYRQLDYWARTNVVRPSLVDAHGSGHYRRYSEADLAVLRFIKQMLDSGVHFDRIRSAVAMLQSGDGLVDGSIVILTGNDVLVFRGNEISYSQIVDLIQSEPCHTFPIVIHDEG